MIRARRLELCIILLSLWLIPIALAQSNNKSKAFLTTARWKWTTPLAAGNLDKKEVIKNLLPTHQQIGFAWSDQPFSIHIPFKMRVIDVEGRKTTPHYTIKWYVTGFGPLHEKPFLERFEASWRRRQDALDQARNIEAAAGLRDAPPGGREDTADADTEERRHIVFSLDGCQAGWYRSDGGSLFSNRAAPLITFGSGRTGWWPFYNLDRDEERRKKLEQEGHWPAGYTGRFVEPNSDCEAAFFFCFDPRDDPSPDWDQVGEKVEGVFHYEIEERVYHSRSREWKWEGNIVAEGELPITIRQNGFQIIRMITGERGEWGSVFDSQWFNGTTEMVGKTEVKGNAIHFATDWVRKWTDSEDIRRERVSKHEADVRLPLRLYDHVEPIVAIQHRLSQRNEEGTVYDKWMVGRNGGFQVKAYRVDPELSRKELRQHVQEDDITGTETDEESSREPADAETTSDDDEAPQDSENEIEFYGHNMFFGPYPGNDEVEPGWKYDEFYIKLPKLRNNELYISQGENFDHILPNTWAPEHQMDEHRLLRVTYGVRESSKKWGDRFADVYVMRLSDLLDNRAGGHEFRPTNTQIVEESDDWYYDWYDDHCELARETNEYLDDVRLELYQIGREYLRKRKAQFDLIRQMGGGWREQARGESREVRQFADIVNNAWIWTRDRATGGDYIETENLLGLSNDTLEAMRKSMTQLRAVLPELEAQAEQKIKSALEKVDVVIRHYEPAMARAEWWLLGPLVTVEDVNANDPTEANEEEEEADSASTRLCRDDGRRLLRPDLAFWTHVRQVLPVELYEAAGMYDRAAELIDTGAFESTTTRTALALIRARLTRQKAEEIRWRIGALETTGARDEIHRQYLEIIRLKVEALEQIRDAAREQPENESIRRLLIDTELEFVAMVAGKLEREKAMTMGAFAQYMHNRGFPLDDENTWWNTLNEWRKFWWGSGPLSYVAWLRGHADMLGESATTVAKEVAQYHVGMMVIRRLRRQGLPFDQMVGIDEPTLSHWLHLRTPLNEKLPPDKVRSLAMDVRAVFRDLPEMKALAEPGSEGKFVEHYGFRYYEPLFTAENVEMFSDVFSLWNVTSTVWPCAIVKIGGRSQWPGVWRSVAHRMGQVTPMTRYSEPIVLFESTVLKGLRIDKLMARLARLPGGQWLQQKLAKDARLLETLAKSERVGDQAALIATHASRMMAFMTIYICLPELTDEALKKLPFSEYTSPLFTAFIHALAELSALENGYELLAKLDVPYGKIARHVDAGEEIAKKARDTYTRRREVIDDSREAVEILDEAGASRTANDPFEVGEDVAPADMPNSKPPDEVAGVIAERDRPSSNTDTEQINPDHIDDVRKASDTVQDLVIAVGQRPPSRMPIGFSEEENIAEVIQQGLSKAENGQYKAAQERFDRAETVQDELEESLEALENSIKKIKQNESNLRTPSSAPNPQNQASPPKYSTMKELIENKNIPPREKFDPTDAPTADDFYSFRPPKDGYWETPSADHARLGDNLLRDQVPLEDVADEYRKAIHKLEREIAEASGDEADKLENWLKYMEQRLNRVELARQRRAHYEHLRATTEPLDVKRPFTGEEYKEIRRHVKEGRVEYKEGSKNPVFFISDESGNRVAVFKVPVLFPADGSPPRLICDSEVISEEFFANLVNKSGMGNAPYTKGFELDVGTHRHHLDGSGSNYLDLDGPYYGILQRYVPGTDLKDLPMEDVIALAPEWAKHTGCRYMAADYDGHGGNLRMGSDGQAYEMDFGMGVYNREHGAVREGASGWEANVTEQHIIHNRLIKTHDLYGQVYPAYQWLRWGDGMVSGRAIEPTLRKFRGFHSREAEFKQLIEEHVRRPVRDADGNIVRQPVRDADGNIIQDPDREIQFKELTPEQVEDIHQMFRERSGEVGNVFRSERFSYVVPRWHINREHLPSNSNPLLCAA